MWFLRTSDEVETYHPFLMSCKHMASFNKELIYVLNYLSLADLFYDS